MNLWLVTASILSALVCLLHVFAGGPPVTRQLIKSAGEKGEMGRKTAYYAWHLVTIMLAGQALAFWLAANSDSARDLALFAAGGAALFALWSLMMIAIHRLKPMLYPQWLLFIPIAATGFAGLYL